MTLEQLESWAKNADDNCHVKLNGAALLLEESLRHLPRKRLTCRAKWQGQAVIAKFFYGSQFLKHLTQEESVLNALIDANIKTPNLLHVHQQDDFGVLIIEFKPESTTLLNWLNDAPVEPVFESILSNVTNVMLACHKLGFEIRDPHLDNFLVQHNEVFIIDAGDINSTGVCLGDMQSIKNLALLYAQLPVVLDAVAFQVLEKITNGSSLNGCINKEYWQTLVLEQRRWRQKKFIDKKVFRECSAFICEQSNSKFLVAKRIAYTPEMEQALQEPDALIENGHLLKDGNTATVARVEINGQYYVLKRYNIKKPIHSIIRGFKWSRAAVSWRNGLLLEMLGIPTAKSYVLIEERVGALRRRSFLLSEYIDAPQAWDIYEGDSYSEQDKIEWAEKIYGLFMLLKQSQISHGDLKAQNILCPPNGALFIDLDGMKSKQSPKGFNRQFNKDINRFHISWPEKWKFNPYFFDRLTKVNKA